MLDGGVSVENQARPRLWRDPAPGIRDRRGIRAGRIETGDWDGQVGRCIGSSFFGERETDDLLSTCRPDRRSDLLSTWCNPTGRQ